MRSNILALRQRSAELSKGMRRLLDNAQTEHRDLTPAEDQHFKKLQAAGNDLHNQIIAEEQRLVEEGAGPMTPDENSAFAALANGQTPAENPSAPRSKRFGRVGIKSFAELFGQPQGNSGFQSFEQYLHAVRLSGQLFDPRLQMAHTEDNPSQAGFLVPDQFASFVLNYALENAICMSRCQVWPMAGEVLKVPGTRDDDHSAGSLYNGITEVWYSENATLDEQNMQTRMVQLTAHKLGMLANASSELTEDSGSFENLLSANLQAAASFFTDRAFFFGNGTGKPLGMLDPNNPSLVAVDANTATPNGGFLWEDACSMFTAMAPACRMRATWVFSDELIPALSTMQLVVKNAAGSENVGGSATPMFTMNADGTGTLMGRPALFTEKLKSAGSQADAAFVCFDQYAIGIRRELQLRRSIDAGFKQDSIWWRLTTRIDGQPTWESKLKLSNGNTVSPFVTLKERT